MARSRLAVVGLWHLGCVVSAGLAHLGHTVCATDLDLEVVRRLQQGILPVYEPGLSELMARQREEGRLAFMASCAEAFAGAEFIFLTLDTPVDDNDESDLTSVVSAFDAIGENAPAEAEIVVMSQVPVGTCRQLTARLRRRAPQLALSVVYHPENLRLGQALRAFLEPDFLLVGAEEETAADHLLGLYASVSAPHLKMSTHSAELAKHALNAFLATSISFANELASLAEACHADVRDVVRVLRHDRRIGPHAFLRPGPGFSGGTLGRDIQTLRHLGEQAGRKTLLLDAALAVNRERLPQLVEAVRQACGSLRGKRVGLLGLTYKPGTNTLRRSHGVALARYLLEAGAEVRAHDPQCREPLLELTGLAVCRDAYQTAESADALVIVTPWPEFKSLDWGRLHQAMRQPVLIDAHNCLDDRATRAAGWRYRGIGIPESSGVAVPTGATS